MKELNIAGAIIAGRRERGLTQEDLAEYMGVSKASVSKWETGQSYPDITLLPRLATYFNISVDKLIGYQPQLTKEAIRVKYQGFCSDFAEKPFTQVYARVQKLSWEYYSCFPLLLQMGGLMVNHCNLASAEEKPEVIAWTKSILQRIKAESQDFELSRMANHLEAACCLISGEAAQVVELLEESNIPYLDNSTLISSAYMMLNKPDKARASLQMQNFQNVLLLIQSLIGLQQIDAVNSERTKVIESRLFAIIEAFNLEKLHPIMSLSAYLSTAQVNAVLGDREKTYDMLHRYVLAVEKMEFPLKLHTDEFYTDLDKYLDSLDLGVNAPLGDKMMRKNIGQGVIENPAFTAIREEAAYHSIVQRLKSYLDL